MAPGKATYLRFRAHLILKDLSLTNWAADRGTGAQQVRQVIVRFAGSDQIPTNAVSKQILAAVEAELAGATSMTDAAT